MPKCRFCRLFACTLSVCLSESLVFLRPFRSDGRGAGGGRGGWSPLCAAVRANGGEEAEAASQSRSRSRSSRRRLSCELRIVRVPRQIFSSILRGDKKCIRRWTNEDSEGQVCTKEVHIDRPRRQTKPSQGIIDIGEIRSDQAKNFRGIRVCGHRSLLQKSQLPTFLVALLERDTK